jgi:hypothetical protein
MHAPDDVLTCGAVGAILANPAGESIRKYLAIYARFIAINVAVARRRTGDLLSAGSWSCTSRSGRFAPGRVTNAATATAPRPARSARTRPVSRPMSRASSSQMVERWPSSPMGMSICVPRSMPSASPHAGGSRQLGPGLMRRMPIACTSTSCSTGRAIATASVCEAIAADQSRISVVAKPRCGAPLQASAIRREAGRSQAE